MFPCRNSHQCCTVSLHHEGSLPLCGDNERVLLISEILHVILRKITVNQAQDGVEKSETFVDKHTATREDFVNRTAQKTRVSACKALRLCKRQSENARVSACRAGL